MPAPPHLADAGPAYSRLDRIIDAIRQALIVLDEKLRIIYCQPRLLPRLRRHAGGDGWPAPR